MADQAVGTKIRVICGANVEEFEEMAGLTVQELRDQGGSILNITAEHKIVTGNGNRIEQPKEYLLRGDEEVEFKKPSGQKG